MRTPSSSTVEIAEIVRELSELVTPRIVAGLTCGTDPDQVREWQEGRLVPAAPAQSRLRFAHELLGEIQAARRTSIAQA